MSLKDRIPAQTSYKFLLSFLTAAFMLLTAAQVFGQLEAGKISGTVRDTSGAVIPRCHGDGKECCYGRGTIGAIRKHRPVPDPKPYSGNL